MEVLEAALRYAEMGWFVLPTVGKVPQGGTGWQDKATNDSEAVKRLFACHHDGVGLLLGEKSGIVDIECDSEEAEHTLFGLLLGEVPNTPTFVSTRGKHYLFRWRAGLPSGTVFKIHCLEFRLGNGKAAQSVLPPSPGRTWEIGPETPVDDFPAWAQVLTIREQILKPKKFAKTGSGYPYYGDGETLNVPRWLEKHGQNIVGTDTGKDGASRWFIECPGIDSHTTKNSWRDCCVTQDTDGRLGGHCLHQSCGMNNWEDLRDTIGPLEYSDYQEPLALSPVDLSFLDRPGKKPKQKNELDEFPKALFQVPGIVGEFVSYCERTAPRFIPEAALSAAIGMISVLTGRKIRSKSGMRTNVYMILLAPSRAGKDWPRGRCRDSFNLAGLDSMLGATKFASDAGLISQIHANPAVLFQIDEVNRFFATINNAGAKSPHLAAIFSTLMELHGEASNAAWTPKGYGDSKNNKTISYPHCAMFCTGVPDGFWAAIKATDATDGFLARMMVIEANYMPRLHDRELTPPPARLIELLNEWGDFTPGGGNLRSVNPEAMVMPFDSQATKRLWEHSEAIEDKMASNDPCEKGIWAGTSANARKLSMIFAASRGTKELIVNKQDADYGVLLANWCTKLLIARILSHVSETPEGAKRKKVLDIIRSYGEITKAELTRKTQFLRDGRERRNILDELRESEMIVSSFVPGEEGRPKEVFTLKLA